MRKNGNAWERRGAISTSNASRQNMRSRRCAMRLVDPYSTRRMKTRLRPSGRPDVRIAVLNWSSRTAGGIETYLSTVIPELARIGCEIGFWYEVDEPRQF